MTTPEPAPVTDAPAPTRLPQVLSGRTILIAADRRSEEFAGALERRGARVLIGPAMRNVPLADDAQLLDATRQLIATAPEIVVITTGVGFRGWLTAADGAGLGNDLRRAIGNVRLLARGPKSAGAIQAEDLHVEWVAESETAAEVRNRLLAEDLTGKRVAVQHHGAGSDGLDEAFTTAGAHVASIIVYRWGPPSDPAALRTTLALTARGQVDAVAYTSAPGTQAWFEAAQLAGHLPAIVDRFHNGMIAAAVGPVTAVPIQDHGITPIQPTRYRLGALAKLIVEQFSGSEPERT